MVDFNNEATVGTPAVNVVKILLLQARANALEGLEAYNKKISIGVEANQDFLKARFFTWYLEHQAYLKRTMKKEDYKEFSKIMEDKFLLNEDQVNKKDIIDAFQSLNEIADELRITRIDLKKKYDKSDIEEDNAQNDLG